MIPLYIFYKKVLKPRIVVIQVMISDYAYPLTYTLVNGNKAIDLTNYLVVRL